MSRKFGITVCVVIFPPPIQCTPLSNLTELLSTLTRAVYIVSSKKSLEGTRLARNVQLIEVNHKASSNAFTRIINYIATQLMILRNIILIYRRVDFFIFFIGGESLLIPSLALKFLKRKFILMPGGIASKGYLVRKDPLFKFMSLLVTVNFSLADRIVVYSHALIRELNINQGNKTIVAHRHFVDFTKFMIKKRISERANVVGYIGRFADEKGILNLVKSISLVLNRRKDVRFVLCGEGELSDEIRKIIQRESLEAYVRLTGWISHTDIPNFLNDFKLLVLPSYTEGLPNIMLEAMACGTPVLATQVGAIPDIIKDNETGFLLKSNDPKYIAERTVELLNEPGLLEKVSINAYNYVRENFSYAKTLETWRRILQEIVRMC